MTPPLAFLCAYLIGALPLGSLLVEHARGVAARGMNPHTLGVATLLHLVGIPVAFSAFVLDLIKGALPLALAAGSPWAALGVYVGHLYPLPWRDTPRPRGRGHGVLFGVIAGLSLYGSLPFVLALVPIVVYALFLALTDYVVLGSVAGLASLALVTFAVPHPALALLTVLALWRHKAGLARVLDQTEPKLTERLPVYGSDPGVVLTAFMIHPIDLDDLWQTGSYRWLKPLHDAGLLSEAWLRRLGPYLRPIKFGELQGIHLSDGRELRVMLIGGPMLPEEIRAKPHQATRMAIMAARLAHELGAESFGLGAFWSTVGNKGEDVQRAVPQIHITNGGAYTAATVKAAVPGLLRRFAAEGGSLKEASAAVVGANGVVAFGIARVVAPEVAELVLVGRDEERLARSAHTLRRKHPHTHISTSTSVAACDGADLVFTATSDPRPVLYAKHVKPGAWVFDLGRPSDAAADVHEVPGVHVVPGGVVRPPGAMRSLIDMHFGDGLVPACLAETMIMSATRAFDRKSLGAQTRAEDIAYYLAEGERLGFEIITRDSRVHRPTELV